MADLALVFRTQAVRSGEPPPPYLDDVNLGARLAALCARARAAFPSLAVSDETFVRHLAGCVARVINYPASLDDFAIEDLYIVCACLTGVPGAIAAFDARCSGPIRAALASVPGMEVDRDELEQQLRVRLLVSSGDVPPRIASYLGEGALGRWVGVAAQRLAISSRRADDVEAGARDRAAIDGLLDWNDPAVLLAKERFRAEFQRALADAVALLDDRGRILLRMHFINGMSTKRISTVYNVSQPTASRWLQAAREAVAAEIQRLLRERLKLDSQEVQSLAALVASQLDLSLSQMLDAPPAR